MTGRIVRAATPDDAAAIAAIYAPYVRGTAITFELEPPDTAEMGRRIAAVTAHRPWLVAEEAGEIVGYAYADSFRVRAAYRWVVETAVYAGAGAQRRGIGRSLYTPLLEVLKREGYVAAIGAIALPNAASVALHEAMGFVQAGTYRGVGYKLGAWHDVGLWQCELAPRTSAPDEPGRH